MTSKRAFDPTLMIRGRSCHGPERGLARQFARSVIRFGTLPVHFRRSGKTEARSVPSFRSFRTKIARSGFEITKSRSKEPRSRLKIARSRSKIGRSGCEITRSGSKEARSGFEIARSGSEITRSGLSFRSFRSELPTRESKLPCPAKPSARQRIATRPRVGNLLRGRGVYFRGLGVHFGGSGKTIHSL